MHQALAQARTAFDLGQVPVGCVIIDWHAQSILANTHNGAANDPLAHAEMLALDQVSQHIRTSRLDHTDIYVTLEPCAMCAAAISLARIRRLYFGAYDPKSGAIDHGPCLYQQPTIHHKPEVYGGIHANQSSDLLRRFFQARRAKSGRNLD